LTYSYKTVLFISVAAVSSTTHALILFPSVSTNPFDVLFVSQLLSLSALWALSTTKNAVPSQVPGSALLENQEGWSLFSNEFTSGLLTNRRLTFFYLALTFWPLFFF
jgi:hypothetical protein